MKLSIQDNLDSDLVSDDYVWKLWALPIPALQMVYEDTLISGWQVEHPNEDVYIDRPKD